MKKILLISFAFLFIGINYSYAGIDTSAPTGTILINGGATYASSTSVVLTLSAEDPSGVALMAFSNWSSYSDFEPYAETKLWTLASTNGTKTVRVRFVDTLGNGASTTGISTTIILDTVSPTLSLPEDIIVEATGPSGSVVNFTASATDINPANPTVTCSPISGSEFPMGTTTVSCIAIDDAGNYSNGSFNVSVVDTVKPVITLNGSDTTRVRRNSTFTDPGVIISDSGSGIFSSSTESSVRLTTNGTYSIKYNAVDWAGNNADEVTRVVTVYSSGKRTTINNSPEVLGAETVFEQATTTSDITNNIETPTLVITAVPLDVAKELASSSGLILGSGNYLFGKNIGLGSNISPDVTKLQEILIKEGFLKISKPTGIFGILTKDAVIKYQEKYADEILKPLGLVEGTGFVGPYTRTKLNM